MRTSFSKLSLLALPLAALTACQDYDPLGEDGLETIIANKNLQTRYNEYTENFIKLYGMPDANHNWGFTKKPDMTFGNDFTRAGKSNTIDVNRNQWIEREGDSYKSSALALNIDVPGWPNFDGHYYAANGDHLAEICCEIPAKDKNYIPAGDVTEYEIQYVSEWFRTYPKGHPVFEGAKVKLHLSDFFVQNVSADYDQLTYPNGTDITDAGIAYANESAMDHRLNIWTKDNSHDDLSYSLDYLHFMPIGADVNDKNTWTHINNFNHGSTNMNPENHAGNNPERMIMYVYSSGTENFAARPSFGTGTQEEEMGDFIDSWVLVKLEWDEKGKCCSEGGSTCPSNGHHRVGYYLAFDYQSKKYDENGDLLADISCDGYYSNWIIKISSANFTEEAPAATRVMCEDLGNTYDFDFNDVVFDVAFHSVQVNSSTRRDAVINLQAAGGTMPIYVGFPSDKFNGAYEAHGLLEHSTSTPVNVGDASHYFATYRIENVGNIDAGGISIWVENGGQLLNITGLTGNLDNYNNGEKGESIAPQRFAVPTNVQWMEECKFIQDGYPRFKAWVNTPNANKTWYNAIGDNSLIYDYVALPSHHSYVEGEEDPANAPYTVNLNGTGGGSISFNTSAFTNAKESITFSITGLTSGDDLQLRIDYNFNGNQHQFTSTNKNWVINNTEVIDKFKKGEISSLIINYTNCGEKIEGNLSITCN